nr:hypothetical protein [Legionella israelensis]
MNASRGGIVNEPALLAAKETFVYCTDVYRNEPDINPEIIEYATLCTPHIAGHSIEAKYEAVFCISRFFHRMLGLPPPDDKMPFKKQAEFLPSESAWQDTILSIYNPLNETLELKKSSHLKETFLQLRKAHDFRHDFKVYAGQISDRKLQEIMGAV